MDQKEMASGAGTEPTDAGAKPTGASAEPTGASAEPTGASAEPMTASECATDENDARRKASGRGPFRLRTLVSLTLLLLFLTTATSGLLLFFAPAHGAGRGLAEVGGWRIHQWAAFHAASTIALVVACLAHLVLNARTLWCYLRGLRAGGVRDWRLPISRELLVALPLALLVVAGAAWCTPSAAGTGLGRGRGHAWRHDGTAAGAPMRAAAEREPRRGAEGPVAGRGGRGMRGPRAGRPRR